LSFLGIFGHLKIGILVNKKKTELVTNLFLEIAVKSKMAVFGRPNMAELSKMAAEMLKNLCWLPFFNRFQKIAVDLP
jgi:hypothetical protein